MSALRLPHVQLLRSGAAAVQGIAETVLPIRREGPEQRAATRHYERLLSRAAPLAFELRHEPSVVLRDGDEVICACDGCSALGYGDTVEDIVGGAPFEDHCPNAEPPAITALAMMHVPRSRRPGGH